MCCGNATWKREVVQDHKFDFVDIESFRTTGFFTRLRYAFVYIFMVKSVLVYVSDIYTAVAMLANDYWSGNILAESDGSKTIQVPFTIGKWIFFGCIIFSFLLLAWESRKARMIIRSRDISYAFTNVMANNYYSLKSYNHFCFFSQIENSKKRKDEFAFFVFFTFKGWKRLLLADAPRQVINALTLYSFGKAFNFTTDLSKYYNDSDGNFSFVRAGVLCTMIFTVVMWAGSAILLTIAAVMYIPLLCYIQGNLKEYCCHKIDKRIAELMKRKTKKRIAREQELAKREAAGDFRHLKDNKGRFKDGQAPLPQPTLPTIDLNDEELYHDGKSEAGHSSRHGTGGRGGQGGYGYPPMPVAFQQQPHPKDGAYPRYQLSDGPMPGAMDSSYSLAGAYPYPNGHLGPPNNDSMLSLDDKASIRSRDPLLQQQMDANASQASLNRAPSYKTQETDDENDAYFAQMALQYGGPEEYPMEKTGGGQYGQYHRDEMQRIVSEPNDTPRQEQHGYFRPVAGNPRQMDQYQYEPSPHHPQAEPPYAMSEAGDAVQHDGRYSPRTDGGGGGAYPPNQQYYQSYRSDGQHQQQQQNQHHGGYAHSSYPSQDLTNPYAQYASSQRDSRSHTPSRSRDLVTSPTTPIPQIHTSRSPSPPNQAPQAQLRYPAGRGVSLAARSDVTTFYALEDRDRQSIADSQAGAFDLDDYARMSAYQRASQQAAGNSAGQYWAQGTSGRRSQLDMLDEEDELQEEVHPQGQGQHHHQQQDWRR